MKRNPNGMRARLLVGLAVTAALLVPLAVFGGPALARSTASATTSASQYQYRVQICHRTGSKKHPFHTITVSSAAVAAHLRHGDKLNACTGNETVTPKHNNGKGHGATSGTTTPGDNGKGHGATSGTTTPGDNGKGHGKGHGK